MRKVFTMGLLAVGLVMAAACKKTTEDKKIFSDDFNRANGSLGSNYTTYLPSGTTFTISGNAAYPTYSSGAPSAFYSQIVTGRVKVSVKLLTVGNAFTGLGYLFVRSQLSDSPSSLLFCGYNSSSLIMGKLVSGTQTILGSAGLLSNAAGVTDTLTATLDGTSTKCELSGSNNMAITVYDSTYGDGYVGIAGGGSAGNYLFIDDLLIEKL